MKKQIKKIVWLMVLILARQIWGWACNLYLLTYQPRATIRNLIETRDKSQLFLLAVTIISPSLLYILVRVGWDWWRWGRVLPGVGVVFETAATIQIIVAVWIGYWFFRALRR